MVEWWSHSLFHKHYIIGIFIHKNETIKNRLNFVAKLERFKENDLMQIKFNNRVCIFWVRGFTNDVSVCVRGEWVKKEEEEVWNLSYSGALLLY